MLTEGNVFGRNTGVVESVQSHLCCRLANRLGRDWANGLACEQHMNVRLMGGGECIPG